MTTYVFRPTFPPMRYQVCEGAGFLNSVRTPQAAGARRPYPTEVTGVANVDINVEFYDSVGFTTDPPFATVKHKDGYGLTHLYDTFSTGLYVIVRSSSDIEIDVSRTAPERKVPLAEGTVTDDDTDPVDAPEQPPAVKTDDVTDAAPVDESEGESGD